MECETIILRTHQTHVMPINASAHWRTYTDPPMRCPRPAEVRVLVRYPDGMMVERNLCRTCADEWQRHVRALEVRQDVPALGIIWPKSEWIVTPLTESMTVQ